MFEKANKVVPWIIATGIWANFALAVYTGKQARAINIEFTKALENVALIKSNHPVDTAFRYNFMSLDWRQYCRR